MVECAPVLDGVAPAYGARALCRYQRDAVPVLVPPSADNHGLTWNSYRGTGIPVTLAVLWHSYEVVQGSSLGLELQCRVY